MIDDARDARDDAADDASAASSRPVAPPWRPMVARAATPASSLPAGRHAARLARRAAARAALELEVSSGPGRTWSELLAITPEQPLRPCVARWPRDARGYDTRPAWATTGCGALTANPDYLPPPESYNDDLDREARVGPYCDLEPEAWDATRWMADDDRGLTVDRSRHATPWFAFRPSPRPTRVVDSPRIVDSGDDDDCRDQCCWSSLT